MTDVNDLFYVVEDDPYNWFRDGDWWSIEGNRDFVADDGTVFPGQPCLWIGSGKYTTLVENWSDEVEVYPIVDLTGFRMLYVLYGSISCWSYDWKQQYYEAMNGSREALDAIVRQGFVEEGFRTMTGYGYDFEGWELLIDWDFNDVHVVHGASVVGRSIYEEEQLRPIV